MKKDYVAPSRKMPHCSTYQRIDGKLLAEEVRKKFGTLVAASKALGCTSTMIGESCKRNYIGKAYLTGLCLLLEKPMDYFDEKEVKEEEVTEEPVKKEDQEMNIDLLLQLKKIEALLISINRKLDGKPTGFVAEK